VTYKHGLHIIRHHNHMSYVQNIIANEAGLKSCLDKTGLIAGPRIVSLTSYYLCFVPAETCA
jgi:hypothetical protein